MWISRKDKWHCDSTDLEKFLFERIIQRTDYEEIISNKHRTINGYTQIKELQYLCELTMKRQQTIRTLATLLEEAKDELIMQNIVNDTIIEDYFNDIKTYIKKYSITNLGKDRNSVNINELKQLEYQLGIFSHQLDKHYFDCLRKELSNIDYANNSFDRNARRISDLVDLLIPYLLFQGYSISSLGEFCRMWLENQDRPTAQCVLEYFNAVPKQFSFLLYLGEPNDESRSFLQLLKANSGENIIEFTAAKAALKKIGEVVFKPTDCLALHTTDVIDPNNHIRQTFDGLIKRVVIQRDRQSLNSFNKFFVNSFWKPMSKNGSYRPFRLGGDPINVVGRTHTLRETLHWCSKHYNIDYHRDNELCSIADSQILNSLYFYNLALGSKSIENSLSLLWTSLESLIPYRIHTSDIECVQHFVSTAVSLSAIARDLQGIVVRIIRTRSIVNHRIMSFNGNGLNSYSPDGLLYWFEAISETKDDIHMTRTNELSKTSNLLAYQYCYLGQQYAGGKLEYVLNRMESSRRSTSYQLQRIYLHRNQIIHAGELINEYTNLWSHLEWYVGKMLAHYIIDIELTKNSRSMEESFRRVEANHQYIMSYLNKNKSTDLKDISQRIKLMLFDNVQFSF